MNDALRMAGVWDPAPVPLVVLALSAALYLVGAQRLRRRSGRPWPARRTACFISGLAVTALALVGPPGAYDDTFFFAHMAQHVLLVLLAAPLLVLGDPVLLALRASSPAVRRRWLVPAYRSGVVRRLASPVTGWLLLVGVVTISHVPAVYDFALAHAPVHDFVEHPLYLLAATVYFWPLLGPTGGPHRVPHGARLVSLFSVMVPMALLGFLIYAAGRLEYPFYAHVDRPFGPGPLADQRLSGALMWSSAMVLSVGWLVLGGAQWLQADERRTRRLDRVVAAPRTADQP